MLVMIRMKGEKGRRLYKALATSHTVMRHRLVRTAMREFRPDGRLEELRFYPDLAAYMVARSINID